MKKYCGILIDSSCTYDAKFIQQHNVEVAPLSFSDDNNKVYDDDNKEINHEELLKRLDNHEMFKTSATPIGKLMAKVEEMLERYEHVVFLPISLGLSSQYAQSLIVQQDYIGKFFPIKSTSGAIANEFVLYEIVKLVEAKTEPKVIVEKAQELYKYILTYFSCEDLGGMQAGGRVTKTIMKVINLFKLKPIIQLDGKNQYGGIGRNYQVVTKKIINNIRSDFETELKKENIEQIGIYLGGYGEEKKSFLLESFSKAFEFAKEKIIFRMIPTVVLVHTRRGAYGITIKTNIFHKQKKYED
ncbi:MAG: DegV family protein [Mycoplasmataceae bacterium]|jgi:DegV family protein with EDD domain|nr:DegV family protein [Mycoplasmataceae bacterium]